MGAIHAKGRLLGALLLVSVAMAVAQSFKPPVKFRPPSVSRWYIHVVNGLSDATLFLHCKSKDDDLGNQVLPRGANFQWNFQENLWGTTLFWCFLRKPGATVSFESFWHEKHHWLHDRCGGTCIWTAKDDGIYLKNIPNDVDELIHTWIPSKP